ncbi:glycosyltransferase family 4 protein [bacterium]|nr:glycosyltransferase family 4 protein [bacterium]
MKKILFVTKYHFTRYTGGAELQCAMLAEEFANRGWSVHYVSENSGTDAPSEWNNVKLHRLPENPDWRTCNRNSLKQVIEDVKPDVIYNRVFDLYTAHVMALAPKGCVTIWAAAAALDGFIWRHQLAICAAKPLRQILTGFRKTVYVRRRAQKAIRHATLTLAQLDEHKQTLNHLGIHPVLVRNSVTPCPESEMQSHNTEPVVLWIGSIKPWKRPELFFELCKRCEDADTRFFMVGEVQDAACQSALDRAIQELPNFHYLGFIPPDRVGEIYRQAHVLVSTSQAEGFPNTFTQAWMRGVPVLSLDVDPDGMLTSGGLGVYVTNVDELERELRKLLAAPDLRREIGARAREFTLKEFDLKANVTKLEKLIEQARKKISPSL